jgi:[protein-PII] uridylyltransferase
MTAPRPADTAFRPAVARAAAAVTALRARIAAQHAAGAPGVQTCGLAAELFDDIVREVWRALLDDLPEADAQLLGRHVALVAHGGYGRRQMAPFSDLDLMLLHDVEGAGVVAEAAKRLLQDLFDAGLDVGQSVRTVAGACHLAAADATILSTLLDCRPLAGDVETPRRLAARLRGAVARRGRRLAESLVAARRLEADRFGHTVALLEPNVKRSPGGLRDIQMVHWLGILLFGAESLDELVQVGGVPRANAEALREAEEFLVRVRNELHLAAGKPADDLTRAEQWRIAESRGLESCHGLLGVERFMREYFGHTRRVERILGALQRVIRRAHPLRSLAAGLLGHRVDGLFRVGPAFVAPLPGCTARVVGSLPHVLRLVELATLYDMPVEPEAWEAVRGSAATLPRDADAAANAAFLRLFDHPQGLAGGLRALHEAGLLEILVPEFAHARHLLQFNNYHKYTVDEHCILAVERAAGFAADRDWLGDTWRQVTRKRPLLLALLIHDIGKGFEGDHSEIGARIARHVTARLGLPADEAEIVEFLVLKHLAMAHMAFRRNVGDDSLVAGFARDVGSPEVLRMMSLLTAADVAAVGPDTWNKWKADLLGDLHFRTLDCLDGESPSREAERARRGLEVLLADRATDDPVLRIARMLPVSYLRDVPRDTIVEELGRLAGLDPGGLLASARWQPGTGTVGVTVGGREDVADGIFHRVTGALTSQRLEILAADIHTLDDRLVIDHFVVRDPDFAGEPPSERLAEIAAAIRAAMKGEPPSFQRRWNPFAPLPAPATLAPARVRFDNESSEHATIIEVFAHDAVGLLYAIAKTLFDAGISVRAAKIGTYLDQVVDAFHVTDRDGGKVTDPVRLAELGRALERAAAPITGPV